MRYLTVLVPLMLIFTSCDKQNSKLSVDECNQLALASFRGSPKAAHRLENQCQHVKITYTKEHCQNALNGLIFGKSYEDLKEEFGKHVNGCFSRSDIEKFAKDEDRAMLMNMSKE